MRLLEPKHMAAHDGDEFSPVGRPALPSPLGLTSRFSNSSGFIPEGSPASESAVAVMREALQRARLPRFVHPMPIHDQLDCADDLRE